MNTKFRLGGMVLGLFASCLWVAGCSNRAENRPAGESPSAASETEAADAKTVATAEAADVQAAKTLLDAMGSDASYTLEGGKLLTEVTIRDGSTLTPEDISLLGRLSDLESLQILNYRGLNDEMASQLMGLKNLRTLALTNSVIGDATAENIAKSFPQLTHLDLSSNTNLSNKVLKAICELDQLERLTLVQNRFNDLGTSRLSKLQNLQVLDLRGNMEAGDMTLEIVGALPKLKALKHRSTTVTDLGIEYLAQNPELDSLLMQDFNITNQAGNYLAQLKNLRQLEIFRCQGFGTEGVLALKGMPLERLTLRDLPLVDDRALEVFQDLPKLKRLYLHELGSVSDEGLANLAALPSLEVLDIWAIPQMTDATVDVIVKLPNLKELSIRATDISDASVKKIKAMSSLKSVTLSENPKVSESS